MIKINKKEKNALIIVTCVALLYLIGSNFIWNYKVTELDEKISSKVLEFKHTKQLLSENKEELNIVSNYYCETHDCEEIFNQKGYDVNIYTHKEAQELGLDKFIEIRQDDLNPNNGKYYVRVYIGGTGHIYDIN